MMIGIDIVLGGDNAMVIALASKNLPKKERNKAIYIGTGLAIFVRILLTFLAATLLSVPYVRGIGGILLLYIAYKLLKDSNNHQPNVHGGKSVIGAVKTIVFADLLMGIDNILAVAGASQGNLQLMVLGFIISVPIIIWGSKLILQLIEKYPFLLYVGASMIGFTAGEMMTQESAFRPVFTLYPFLVAIIPILTIIITFTLSIFVNIKGFKGN